MSCENGPYSVCSGPFKLGVAPGDNGRRTESRILESAASNEQGHAGGVSFDDDGDLFLVGWVMNSGFSSGAARVNKFTYVQATPPLTSANPVGLVSTQRLRVQIVK